MIRCKMVAMHTEFVLSSNVFYHRCTLNVFYHIIDTMICNTMAVTGKSNRCERASEVSIGNESGEVSLHKPSQGPAPTLVAR